MPGSGARLLRPSDFGSTGDGSPSTGPRSSTEPPSLSAVVKYNRSAFATISIGHDGSFSFRPNTSETTFCACETGEKHLLVRPEELLGASREGSSSVIVWYCSEVPSVIAGSPKVQFKIRQTERFEVDSAAEADALVQSLRRLGAWQGRDRPPHIVTVLNPVSGRGTARKVLESTVLPLLQDVAGMRVTVHETKRRGHAADILRSLPLADVDVLAFIGGDGTAFEGVQGLLGRSDWEAACKIPFAAIPTGSGNGLAASTGLWDPATAVVALCKHTTHPIDMASVLQPPGSRYYCFLSLVYGLMANLDIGTESWR